MKLWTWIKIYWIKFTTWLSTGISMVVYNFHKSIKGIKTKKNISYGNKSNFAQKFDVHYPENIMHDKPIIVYFHGGGWTAYSKHIFTTLTRRLAEMGYVVFNCNYRLAPKYKIDDIINDGVMAIKKAKEIAADFAGDSSKIILAGDSAGAHIASMIMAKAASGDNKYKELYNNIKAMILLYGVFDLLTMLKSGFPNIKTYASASIRGGINNLQEMEQLSPIKYDLSKFAPCLIASGEIDKLHTSQSQTMYNALKNAGVNAHKVFFNKDEFKAMHSYMIIDGISTNVKTLHEIKKFLKEVVC